MILGGVSKSYLLGFTMIVYHVVVYRKISTVANRTAGFRFEVLHS